MYDESKNLGKRANHTRKVHLRETIRVAHIYLSSILMRVSRLQEEPLSDDEVVSMQQLEDRERIVRMALAVLPRVISKFNDMRLAVRPSATVGDLRMQVTFAKIEWNKVKEIGTVLGLRYDVKDPILGSRIPDMWSFIDHQLEIAGHIHVNGDKIEWAQERLRQQPL
jgi:hypothetical protein